MRKKSIIYSGKDFNVEGALDEEAKKLKEKKEENVERGNPLIDLKGNFITFLGILQVIEFQCSVFMAF